MVRPSEEFDPIVDDVRRSMTQLDGARLHALYLYGSWARNEQDAESDVDFLVLLDNVTNVGAGIMRLSPLGSDLSLKHDRPLCFLPMGVQRFREGKSPFLMNVRREGVPL